MKTIILALLLSGTLGSITRAADPPAIAPANNDIAVMEQRWQTILPELFADVGKQHIGAKVRFTTGATSNYKTESPVVFKLKNDITLHVSNVSNKHRIDIATPHKPPTYVTIEGVITAIDAKKRIVSIKASKVDVTW